ncbi:MAG: isochorismatase family protein, partial [Clostridium butyricum]|nr:isochorismatase family protein [Clostridium butyricum]
PVGNSDGLRKPAIVGLQFWAIIRYLLENCKDVDEALEYLKDKYEQDVVVVGLQTDYCIDATIKCGFEHGFNIIVPEHSNTTVDNKFMSAKQSYEYYNEFIWKNRYAECLSLCETIERMKV